MNHVRSRLLGLLAIGIAIAAVVTRWSAVHAGTRPAGMAAQVIKGAAWLSQAPPPGSGGVLMRCPAGAVAIILPFEIRPNDAITGTIVAVASNPRAEPALAQLTVQDPQGHRYPVVTGSTVSFSASPEMIWSLLDRSGKRLASVERKAFPASAARVEPAGGPLIVQSNALFTLYGYNGTQPRESVLLDGKPARLIAGSPRIALGVAPDFGGRTGRIPVSIGGAGRMVNLEGRAVSLQRIELPGNPPGRFEITIRGLEGLQPASLTRPIQLQLPGGTITSPIRLPIEAARFDRAGIYRWQPSAPALRGGVAATIAITQDKYQCKTVCAGCSGFFGFCDDKGSVNCEPPGNCLGDCYVDGGAKACGRWTCNCNKGRCNCLGQPPHR